MWVKRDVDLSLCDRNPGRGCNSSKHLVDVQKKVALICTTYNCKDELESSLKTFTCPDNLELVSEIVIVDGGSEDGTWELLKQWAEKVSKLKVDQVPGTNISRGRNEAVKRTNADIIVTFDSGTKYGDDWLKLMLEPFTDASVRVVGGLTVYSGETLFENCMATFKDSKRSSIQPSHRGCAFYKQVWEKIGGYPEHVEAGEDTWFNTQWKKMGCKYVHVPEAKQYWRVRKNWTGVFRMARRNTKGHIALGETSGTLTIVMVTAVQVVSGIFLIGGFFNYLMWYAAGGLYGLNDLWRMLEKGRWRQFHNPVKIVVGIYALSAFDLGMTVGAIEGFMLWFKHKLICKRAQTNE